MAHDTREKMHRTTRTALDAKPMWESAPIAPPENAVLDWARRKSELEDTGPL
jgi:hypothetical protein